eukprot:1587106-Heterocapsa_arctica.AAC.1
MAKPKQDPAASGAQSSRSQWPIPKPHAAPPGNFVDPNAWINDPLNPVYIGIPGGPKASIQQL